MTKTIYYKFTPDVVIEGLHSLKDKKITNRILDKCSSIKHLVKALNITSKTLDMLCINAEKILSDDVIYALLALKAQEYDVKRKKSDNYLN